MPTFYGEPTTATGLIGPRREVAAQRRPAAEATPLFDAVMAEWTRYLVQPRRPPTAEGRRNPGDETAVGDAVSASGAMSGFSWFRR